VDFVAIEWVDLPNAVGMSQAAEGGLMASKPDIASAKYIERMSGGSLCARCRYRPALRRVPQACPFNLPYRDLLLRYEDRLAANPRTVMQVRNLARIDDGERVEIRAESRAQRSGGGP
jgi:deoxyribodipyrimidine photolyase-related protein